MNRIATIGLAAMLMLAMSATAEIYTWTDADGRVHYGDRPTDLPAGSTELVPESSYSSPMTGWTAPEISKTNLDDLREPTSGSFYQSVSLVSPLHDETLRSAPGNIQITVTSEPPLREKDGYQLYLDGEPVYEPFPYATVIMPNVDRGTHELQVAIVDEGGRRLLASDKITVHLHRHSIRN